VEWDVAEMENDGTKMPSSLNQVGKAIEAPQQVFALA